MFIVASQRADFIHQWGLILERRGHTRHVDAVAAVRQLLHDWPTNLVVLDFSLIQANPLASLQNLHRQCGETRLLLGGTSFDPQWELAALATGVVACCDATLQHDDLERIVDTVLQGGVWVSRATIPLLVVKLQEFSGRQGLNADVPAPSLLHELTQRQREVAEMISQGANNKQIASTLNITDRTVKAHLTAIFEKLGVSDRLQLALYVNSHSK